jgi:hypothetical protein
LQDRYYRETQLQLRAFWIDIIGMIEKWKTTGPVGTEVLHPAFSMKLRVKRNTSLRDNLGTRGAKDRIGLRACEDRRIRHPALMGGGFLS